MFFLRFVLFFDKIVALSLLPILFIAFGIDELSKIMLIVIGVTPTIILDTFNLTRGVPAEQVVKAFTLGAGDFDVAYRVVLKQIMPRVLNSIRLNLKAVMLFLFAGEMIASTDGLAYRIALLRRHMGMDVIIPYVLWVALLLFLVDLGMRVLNRKLHPWFRGGMTRGADTDRRCLRGLRLAGARRAGGHRSGNRRGRVRLRAGADGLRQVHAAAAGAGRRAAAARARADRRDGASPAGPHARLRSAEIFSVSG